MAQVATFAPWSRVRGVSIRVHFDIRDGSLSGGGTGGSAARDLAVVVCLGGPALTGARRLASGGESRRTSRSCDGTMKNP